MVLSSKKKKVKANDKLFGKKKQKLGKKKLKPINATNADIKKAHITVVQRGSITEAEEAVVKDVENLVSLLKHYSARVRLESLQKLTKFAGRAGQRGDAPVNVRKRARDGEELPSAIREFPRAFLLQTLRAVTGSVTDTDNSVGVAAKNCVKLFLQNVCDGETLGVVIDTILMSQINVGLTHVDKAVQRVTDSLVCHICSSYFDHLIACTDSERFETASYNYVLYCISLFAGSACKEELPKIHEPVVALTVMLLALFRCRPYCASMTGVNEDNGLGYSEFFETIRSKSTLKRARMATVSADWVAAFDKLVPSLLALSVPLRQGSSFNNATTLLNIWLLLSLILEATGHTDLDSPRVQISASVVAMLNKWRKLIISNCGISSDTNWGLSAQSLSAPDAPVHPRGISPSLLRFQIDCAASYAVCLVSRHAAALPSQQYSNLPALVLHPARGSTSSLSPEVAEGQLQELTECVAVEEVPLEKLAISDAVKAAVIFCVRSLRSRTSQTTPVGPPYFSRAQLDPHLKFPSAEALMLGCVERGLMGWSSPLKSNLLRECTAHYLRGRLCSKQGSCGSHEVSSNEDTSTEEDEQSESEDNTFA